MKPILLTFILLLTIAAQAEYRAYRLGIRYHPEDKNEKEVEIISTLDDQQYESYYRRTTQQQTRLISHWMCWNRTDYEMPTCAEPLKPKLPSQDKGAEVRLPASDAAQQSTPSVIK